MNKDSKGKLLTDLGNSAKVQRHQLESGVSQLSIIDNKLDELNDDQEDLHLALLDAIHQAELMIGDNVDADSTASNDYSLDYQLKSLDTIEQLDSVKVTQADSFETIVELNEAYAQRQSLNLASDPYEDLMSTSERIAFEKWVKEDFTYKNAECDKYDYLIAGTCGVIGGLIDVFFVGSPGEGVVGQKVDEGIKGAVVKFAETVGFNRSEKETDGYLKYIDRCQRQDKTPLDKDRWLEQQAVQFLEQMFGINYDQTSNNGQNSGTGGATENLSPSNHHLKSLGHSPDLIGLFFSIYNQFTSTSTFIENGKLITINTKTFELEGGNVLAKIFCGFVNWLGHLFSDMAGSNSSIAKGNRGSGIPIPFYNLLLILDIGEFGQDKQTFATIATKVFEKGYDFRHGIALAIPVLIVELLTRLMWTSKQRFYHKMSWEQCVPTANNPELRRMLLVAHGTLCLIDAGDAALRSGGDMVQFLLRTNILGWVRFSSIAIKDVYAWYNADKINVDAIDEYLDAEYERMLMQV